MTNNGQKTHQRRIRILDVAERLFARFGYDGVTMRKIATDASVDVALASYHFKNKRGLFDAVLWRRSETLNAVRHEALDALLESAGDDGPTIDELIDNCIRPMLCPPFELDEGWHHYYELVASINNSPEWGKEIMTSHFQPLLERFMIAFKKALPDSDPKDIYYSYHYLSGALSLTIAQTGRLDLYSGGLCSSKDLESACNRMIPFLTAGFKAICIK